MHRFLKVVPVLILSLMFVCFATPAKAQFNPFGDMKLPEVTPQDWKVGQSASYAFKVSGVPDMDGPLSFNLRTAIVGQETIEGKSFHWVEIDIKDPKGLPPDISGFAKSLRIKMLTRFIDPQQYNDDPQAMMKEIAAGNVIRKIVFQLNEDTPQMIDFMMISGMMESFAGMDLAAMAEEMNVEETQTNPDVKINCGKENVVVAGKTYANAAFCEMSGSEDTTTFKGKFHSHESIPISAFLKAVFNVKDTQEKADIIVNIDLTDYQTSGAKSEITGTPIPFDLNALMGGMMGGGAGMPPMGGMGR